MTGGANRPMLYKFAVFLAFTVLGAVYSWPAVLSLNSAIPYAYDAAPGLEKAKLFQGDHLQLFYHLGLLKKAALGEIPWFSNPLEFATEYQTKWIYTYVLPVSLIYLPFSFISFQFAYNMLLMASFGLTGLCMYLWADEVTKNKWGAFAAGLVFNFMPFRLVELFGGHPSGHVLFLFPLAMYFFEKAANRKSPLYGALGGITVFSISIIYLFHCYYLFMFLMVYAPWRLVPIVMSEPAGKRIEAIKKLAAAGLPFAIGSIAAVAWMLQFKKAMVETGSFAKGRTMEEVSLYSSKISAMWAANGDWHVYIGLPLLVALIVALVSIAGPLSKHPARKDALFFSTVFFVSYILAFGPTLDRYFHIYSLFYNYFPFYNMSRTPSKIMVLSSVSAAMIVAYAVNYAFAARSKVAAVSMAGAMVFLTAVDYHPRKPVGICVLDPGNPLYRSLAAEIGGKKVLNIPVWPGESSWESIYEYYALESGIPMLNGYSPVVSRKYTENVFFPLASINGGDFTEKQAELLKSLGVSHIVFHEEAYPPKVSAFPVSLATARLANNPYLKLEKKGSPLWLFRILDKPNESKIAAQTPTSPVGVYFEAEWLAPINSGAVDDPASTNGAALEYKPSKNEGTDGIINAGPYVTFPSGDYTATFRLKASKSESGKNAAVIDVAAKEGKTTFARREVRADEFPQNGDYGDFTLSFSLPPGEIWQLEFRAYSANGALINYDWVYVTNSAAKDPLTVFSADDIFHTGRWEEVKANGGAFKAVTAEPGIDPSGLFVYGPSRMIGEGLHTAYFSLAAGSANTADDVAELKVFQFGSSSPIASKMVKRGDLPQDGSFGETALDFKLDRRMPVEFRIHFTGKTKLRAKDIRVVEKADSGKTGGAAGSAR